MQQCSDTLPEFELSLVRKPRSTYKVGTCPAVAMYGQAVQCYDSHAIPMSWKVIVALAAVGMCVTCRQTPQSALTTVTILTGGIGGSFYTFGEALSRIYSRTVPGILATAQSTVASVFVMLAIHEFPEWMLAPKASGTGMSSRTDTA